MSIYMSVYGAVSVSKIWMQLLFFAVAIILALGDNLRLKHPANSCKQVVFAAGESKAL